jgi:hypothetical protein
VSDDPNFHGYRGPWFHIDPTKDADTTGENALIPGLGRARFVGIDRRGQRQKNPVNCGSADRCLAKGTFFKPQYRADSTAHLNCSSRPPRGGCSGERHDASAV